MGRVRGAVAGGYVRKTISLPKNVSDAMDAYLTKHPGETSSLLATLALVAFLLPTKKGR